MKIRCIALDLDRTTLNGQGQLSPGNRDALLYAISKGVHIIIASGRAFTTLPEDVAGLPGVEYAITSNGAAVYHIPTQTCLHRYTMTPQSVDRILELNRSEGLPYEVFVEGTAYADAAYVADPIGHGAAPRAVSYIQKTRHPVDGLESFIRSHREQLDSLDLVFSDAAYKPCFREKLLAEVPDIYVTSSVPELLEISHRDAGKHSGVRFIAEHLGLSPAEIAAFGDGDNDADMLTYVGCGIAMENGTEGCKAAADYVTLHHTQDGVAYGIREILHI